MSLSEIEDVCRFLSSKDIKISSTNDWLKSCVEWFTTENVGCSTQQIQEFAYHQLLLADLCVVAERCLPPSVSENRTTKLSGKYFLQINYVIDVGTSAYSQFQYACKQPLVNLEVTEEKKESWEPKPNRMLKMEITDGFTVVYGMEFSVIKKLKTNVVPGTKIVVKGPVECRNNVIMLEENNLTVLGGEVDSLYDSNHYYRIITKTLKVDETLLPLDDADQGNQQPSPPLESKVNLLPVVTQLSSLTGNCRPTSVSNDVCLSVSTDFDKNYNGQLSDGNDYFADSDVFLNVPVDNFEYGENDNNSVKKKLIEINGSVVAFKSKLIIKENNWFVIVRINSDEGSMKASFDPDLLDRLIGFSPVELNSKEGEIAVNPAVKEKMNFMLKRGQQVIKNLNCQMTLVHEQGSELPVIIAISDENAFYDHTK